MQGFIMKWIPSFAFESVFFLAGIEVNRIVFTFGILSKFLEDYFTRQF